ncbi:MAG: hypothetical protein E3J72_05115 [Planctomycetota bacterium]|nr:MAG: hypothetical protein E3J72_05115 [Planctomycetota bacterium]
MRYLNLPAFSFLTLILVLILLFSCSCQIRGFDEDPYVTPRVLVITPVGTQKGNVALTYCLVEFDGSPADIAVNFSTDGGQTYQTATITGGDGLTNLAGGLFPGIEYSIVWDTVSDGIANDSCRLKIVATKTSTGKEGTPGETLDFAVDNSPTTPPPPQAGSPTVWITDGPAGITDDNAPSFSYMGADSDGTISGYWVGIDANPPTTWTASTTWVSSPLADGPHTFYVMSQDNEGKKSIAASREFTVDTSGGVPYESFNIPCNITRMVFDKTRFCFYATDSGGMRTLRIDALTGNITGQVNHAYAPESLVISPDASKLYVCLLISGHSSYHGDGDGRVSVISLGSFSQTFIFDTLVDPFDVVATDEGVVVVSSGSGQWTSIHSYNGITGEQIGSAGIRQACYIDMHPDQKQVYAANTDTSPSDIEKFLIQGDGTLASMGDSPYHGDHRMSGNVWVSATGDYVVTRGGDVYTSSPVRSNDMHYLMSLPNTTALSDTDFHKQQNVMMSIEGTAVYYYNIKTMIRITSDALSGSGMAVGSIGGQVFVALVPGGGITVIERFPFPVFGGDTNTPPVAGFSYSPDTNLTISDLITFDATQSSDAQEDGSVLLYRWDFNNDGTYDTIWTNNRIASHQYSTNGLQLARLEVRDSLGLIGTKVLPIEIGTSLFEQPFHGSFSLDVHIDEVEPDPTRSYCYVTIPSQQKVAEVNLDTGLIERSIGISGMMESMCLSPDGTTLYVCLLVSGHNYYGGDDGTGQVAVIDVAGFEHTDTFDTQVDPFDIVATDAGVVVVSSGSGQWTVIHSYNATTGEQLGSAGIRHLCNISLHPDQNQVYSANTDTSPSDIEKFIINGDGSLTSAGDSPYHGDHRMNGNVWCAPTGDFVVTRGGDVFNSSMVGGADMIYLASMGQAAVTHIGWAPAKGYILTLESTYLRMYDYNLYTPLHEYSIGPNFGKIFVLNNIIYMTRSTALNTDFVAVKMK